MKRRGFTRETIQDARKIMPRGPSHLEAHTALINNVTIKEAEKMGFDEMGGDFSQDVFRNGWAEVQFANLNWIITIKRTLVPDDTMFMFSVKLDRGIKPASVCLPRRAPL